MINGPRESNVVRMIENKMIMPATQFKIYCLILIRQQKYPTKDRLKIEQICDLTNISLKPAGTALSVMMHKEIIGKDSLDGYYVIR